jgi:hypothetical protein
MIKWTKILFAVALLLAAGGLLLANRNVAYGSPNDTINLTNPAPNTRIAESDDYATQVLGDPWDMNNLDDLDWPHDFTPAGISNGIWSANTMTTNGGTVMLQNQSFTNAYSYVGEKNGVNYPIDSNRFNRLWVRMYVAQGGPSAAWFFRRYEHSPAGNSNIFDLQPGWHIYSMDLRAGGGGGTGTWTQNGPYGGIRFDAPWGANNNPVQFDWVRLTPDNGEPVRITWGYTGNGGNANLYLSPSPDATQNNEYKIGTTNATAGFYIWNNTGVAPGVYYIHAEVNGAWSSIGPLLVNTAPVARLDAPSPVSGEDYAYARLSAPWDSTNPGQFQNVRNVANLNFGPEFISGSATNIDPYLQWLVRDTAHPIDTGRYRYMNVRLWVDPPASRPWSPFNAGARLFWDTGNNTLPHTLMMITPYKRWIQAAWDMRTVPIEGGGTGRWTGSASTFRFDPHEQDDANGQPSALPASFRIQSAHMTSDPIAGRAGASGTNSFGTVVRWTPMQGTGIVNLYYDTDSSGFNGVQFAQNVPLGQGYYNWNLGNVPDGTYWIYMTLHDGTNSSLYYSLVPIAVGRGLVSTIFADVPTNYWAADDINRLAMLNVVNGTGQPDGSALFRPGGTALRSHLSKMVVLAAGWALANPGSPTFTDVPTNHPFYTFIETAVQHGVVSGYTSGCSSGNPCFRPNNSVTRSQTAKMVVVSRGWPVVVPGSPNFADMPYDASPTSLYAYVETARSRGIISGYACGGPGEPCDGQNRAYYRPGNNVTRAQLSKMLSTALGNEPESTEK